MSDAVLLEERDDGIGIITLNRPDNRNSMTPELLDCFEAVTQRVCKNLALRAVVLTGSGNCFSAGADFRSALQRGDDRRLSHERSLTMYEPFLSVLDIEVPVIGALNGHAVGGGFGLALVCDIRIASRRHKYGANFARIGLHPGLGVSYLLPRLIGLSRASELLYTGRLVRGDEAESMGLVSEACPDMEVLPRALKMAATIAQNAPVAVRLTKQSMRDMLGWDVHQGARQEAYAQAVTLGMSDAQEGMEALLEKREPSFTGK